MLDALVPGHLRDVHEPLDAVFQLDKAAVVRHGHDLSADDCPWRVSQVDLVPWIGSDLLASEADALRVLVELEHLDLDLLTNFNHLGWVCDSAIGHVGDVKESVDSAEVDECTVVGDVLDHADHDGANFEALRVSGA